MAYDDCDCWLEFVMIKVIKIIFFLGLILSPSVQAESVIVNVKGEVELESFSCSITNSVLIKRACYKAEEAYLIVQIKDNWFQHCAVDQKKFDALMGAKSFNKFYNEDIKGQFSCYR
jgi:hypothetical protein